MKPLNSHTTGCDPVSSNCVIWQGPDIPCIKLCKGDSISDVVHKLATELCEVLDQLDVSTYQLPNACFTNQSCNPGDFHDLIQLIIYKICCLESGGTDTESCNYANPTSGAGSREAATGGGCPDCTVDIAKCFYYTNEFGDEITTMQLTDYTKAIGNKLCMLVNDIFIQSEILNNHEERITALENTPSPTLLLPTVTPSCVITPAVPQPMNVVLSTLEQQFCQLVSATGTPTNIYQAVTKQCVNLNNSPALGTPGGTMSGIPGWLITANTIAASMNNMWLTLCDLRSAVKNIQLTCCPSGCDGISVTLNAILNANTITVYINGTLPPGFDECDPAGNTFRIQDSLGNYIEVQIDTAIYLNVPTGYSISLLGTPINPAANITISSDLCYKNASTNAECKFCVTYEITNISICPVVYAVTDSFGTGATVTFTPSVVPATYTAEIWNSTFTAVIGTQSTYITNGLGSTFTFTGILTPGTTYNARIKITSGGNTTECPFVVFTTAPVICAAPSSVGASIALPVYCDTCGPALEFSDNPTVDGTYVDVSSDYLLQYSGGSFGNLIQLESDQPIDGTVRQPISFAGRTWVVTNDSNIEVYSDTETGTPVLDTTITPGVSGIVNMIYDTNLDLVFFGYNDLATGFRRIGTIHPTLYTVTLNVGPAFSGGGFFLQELYFNPVNFQKYVRVSDGDVYVLSAGATGLTVLGTITAVGAAALRYVVFDPVSGNAWIATSDSTNTEEILVVNGTTYATITTINTSVAGMQPYVGNVYTNAMAFFSDGANSAVYVIYRSTVANYNYMIIRYNASTYAETTFLNEGVADGALQRRQIFYSTVFGKIVYTKDSIVDMFAPSSSTVDYTPTITLPNGALGIHEDTVNDLLVFSTNVTSPSNNMFWYSLDPSTAVQCTQGIVTMYIGTDGPYQFNSTTSSWDNMCTPSAVAVTGTTFQANATFTTNVLFGALLYSTDGGVTWNAMTDTGGNLYANAATWLAGRVYNVPAVFFTLKITFNTNDDCALESSPFSVV